MFSIEQSNRNFNEFVKTSGFRHLRSSPLMKTTKRHIIRSKSPFKQRKH